MLIFGHPRGKGAKAWTPINLMDVEGEPKTAPAGTFRVRLGSSEEWVAKGNSDCLILQVGPEERPFPELRLLDIEKAAEDVVKALRRIRQNMS